MGGTFSNGKIFGAGSYCSETKLTSTNINISDGTFTEFSIYGGGCYGVVGSSENNVNCNVTIHGGTFHNGVTIYGGGWNKSVYGNTYITINNGATFDQAVVYGGGYQSEYGSELYKYSDIIGDTSIDINGGNIESVYGGGRYGDYGASATVQGKADITVTEGTVNNIYLGGNHEKSQANTAIATIEGGTVTNIYTGTVAGEAFLDYTGGMIIGEVEEELLIPVSFTELKANDATTTTELTLKFSKDPISLTVDKITVTGATKGTLSGNGTERTLTISDITVKNGQNITVAIEAPAFKISPASKEVTVYKLVIPTLTDITLTPVKVNYADRATAGTKVADLAAVGTPTTGITYTLDGSSEDNSLFQIAGTALQIKSGTTLENGREYTVKVKVHENEEPLNTYSETISFEPIIPPTVTSITRQNPQTISTNADTVTYRVTFSEKVIGVDNSDFVLTGTGTVTGTVASISEVSESVMDVTVNGITGEGVLRLELKNSGTGITDIAGNAIDEGFKAGAILSTV